MNRLQLQQQHEHTAAAQTFDNITDGRVCHPTDGIQIAFSTGTNTAQRSNQSENADSSGKVCTFQESQAQWFGTAKNQGGNGNSKQQTKTNGIA